MQTDTRPTTAGKLEPGTRAPDFALPDPQGRTVRLSDLLGHGPIVPLGRYSGRGRELV